MPAFLPVNITQPFSLTDPHSENLSLPALTGELLRTARSGSLDAVFRRLP